MRKAMGRVVRRVGESARRGWQSRAGRFVLILVAVVMVGYVFLWWVPKWQVAHLAGVLSRDVLFERENEARQTSAGILGGLLVLGTLYVTWRRVEVAQEGQITERFTRAIEQLGSEKLEVRLGGIYALERIARDSERDHWPIMEVLTAYVRENAKWSDDRPKEPRPLAADIQAILTVVGRRRLEFEREPELHLDLRGTDLRRGDLRRGQLENADLMEAHLEGAGPVGRSELEGVFLTGANLIGAHLQWAVLREAQLQGCWLAHADLGHAVLSRARLERAVLAYGRLCGAGLVEAQLADADMTGADLRSARLEGAKLPGACLAGANLSEAGLKGADLRGVDLREVMGLTREQIAEAITDETTVLPEYLKEEGEEGKGGE